MGARWKLFPPLPPGSSLPTARALAGGRAHKPVQARELRQMLNPSPQDGDTWFSIATAGQEGAQAANAVAGLPQGRWAGPARRPTAYGHRPHRWPISRSVIAGHCRWRSVESQTAGCGYRSRCAVPTRAASYRPAALIRPADVHTHLRDGGYRSLPKIARYARGRCSLATIHSR